MIDYLSSQLLVLIALSNRASLQLINRPDNQHTSRFIMPKNYLLLVSEVKFINKQVIYN